MRQRSGLIILLLTVVFVGVYLALRPKHTPAAGNGTGSAVPQELVTVKGYIGGEKLGLLADPDVIKILADKYGLRVDATKAGSVEMVEGSTAGQDFLWPSSQVALELYKNRNGLMTKTDTIFASPIVFYSWDTVTDALIKVQVVKKLGDAYYVVDAPKLIHMINGGTQWKDVGLSDLYGRISVRSTDPTKSNSGMMFAGLLANISNNGDVVDQSSLGKTLPNVKTFFSRLGYLEPSSEDLFQNFLKTGEGAYPLIVGYENQLTEFSIDHAEYRDLLRQKIRILYPEPTVWSNHPLIALDANGDKLLTALKDPDIQRLAWEHHGFRSGLIGIQNDPKVLSVVGIPATIQNVMPMPTASIMNQIITSISHG